MLAEQRRLHRTLDPEGYREAEEIARRELKEFFYAGQRACAEKILGAIPGLEVKTPFDVERLAKTILQIGQAVAVLGLPSRVSEGATIEFRIMPPDPEAVERRRREVELATVKVIDVKVA